ncbi:Protein CAH-5 [Aphelenchoides avenae]|nr:Protein CAH-5 [Aphelenchus avenae]
MMKALYYITLAASIYATRGLPWYNPMGLSPRGSNHTFPFHTAETDEWSYEHPEKWPGACTTGFRQSPVDIVPQQTVRVPIPELRFVNYDFRGPLLVAANLHTAGISGFANWTDKQPFIEAGGLSARYHLQQIHVHWSKDGPGSEHVVDGRRHPVEVHLVHSKDGAHPDANVPDKFAVVAVFMEESREANKPLQEQFFSKLRKIRRIPDGEKGLGTDTELRPDVFLPQNRKNFYRYDGSLTTPNCDEAVVWTILGETVKVSKQQTDELRQMKMRKDHPFKDNTRPLQPLNGRPVLQSV